MKKLLFILFVLIGFAAHAQVDSGQYATFAQVGNWLNYKVPTSRTVTINGNTQNMWSDLNFTIAGTAYTAGYGLSLASNVFKSDSTANLSVASFNQRQPNILLKTGNYSIATTDLAAGKQRRIDLWIDATSANSTATIPTASSYVGLILVVGKTDATANTVTISGLSSDNILVGQGASKTLFATTNGWVQL